MRARSLLLSIALTYASAACGSKAEQAMVTQEQHAAAVKLYADRCARCHGLLGKGDGPEAKSLQPRPRNFADPTWQLAIPDRKLDQIIVQGGAAVGRSPAMPGQPDLASRPELLAALRQHLRVLASSPP
jgi:mono/diheme cytochrome c family protein